MKAVIVEDEILIREGLCKLMKKCFRKLPWNLWRTTGRRAFCA